MPNETAPAPVPVDSALLQRLWDAQRAYHVRLLTDPYNRFGDDWGDDTESSFSITHALFTMQWDQEDLHALAVMLNTPPPDPMPRSGTIPLSNGVPVLSAYAGEGICPEIHDLNCPALAERE